MTARNKLTYLLLCPPPLSISVCSPQPVKRWPTLYSTQCGLWVVDPT